MTLELTRDELNLILIGMTAAQYPIGFQKAAFELVMRLREKLREAT